MIIYGDGITYNDSHSYTAFNLIKIDVENHTTPSKKKVLQAVPFMSGSYDFSNLQGDSFYEERELTYVLALDIRALGLSNPVEVEQVLEIKKIQIENWLLNTNNKTKLYDDSLVGYYYLAECTSVDFDKWFSMGKVTINFIAYPFKIAELEEGNDIWDTFNFELDYAQDTKFAVNGVKSITIYNPGGCNITPDVVCNGTFELSKEGRIYKFNPGTTKDWRFILLKGKNDIVIKGNGSIEFKFRKELL